MIILKKNKKEKEENKNTLLYYLLLITIFFNIWFPKAGIKLAGIPMTVGNVFFIILLVLWFGTVVLRRKSIKFPEPALLLMYSIIYFIFKYTYIALINNNFTSSVTYIIPLIIYPFALFIAYEVLDNESKKEKVINIIRYGFYFLCFYALLQFVVGIGGCDIPGLTVNLSDYREMGTQWYMQKSNGTDESNSKIVSTYQNGNLFGINLIFIYSLIYYYLKHKKKEKELIFSLILFIMCTFLTLSRTCWLGIVLFIFIEIIMKREKNKRSLVRKGIILFFCVISLFLVFNFMPSVTNRFLGTDKDDWISMSGRTEGFINVINSILENGNVFLLILSILIGPKGVISYWGVAFEMFPTSLFAQTGIIGMILIYAFYINAVLKLDKNNYISGGIRSSLIIWLIIGIIECGYWLPPTALNIFILVGLAFGKKDEKVKVGEKNEEIHTIKDSTL